VLALVLGLGETGADRPSDPRRSLLTLTARNRMGWTHADGISVSIYRLAFYSLCSLVWL
jgi:hypothetical protein